MAHCSQTAQEFIRNAFAPQIAILCSEDADTLSLKNNLRFVELLQPFSSPKSEVRISDPSGTLVTIKNFKIYFEDMNRRPPQPTLGKKILSEAVASSPWDQESSKPIVSWTGGISTNLTLQTSTPWFEEWREIFLQLQYPSDHEFTKHYVACIIVISAGSENPMDQLNRLSQYQHQQQHQNPTHFPKWFSPNILKYYLLLHDIDDVEATNAEKVFEEMTSAYGKSNCYHLQINSKPGQQQPDSSIPNPWQRLLKRRHLVEGNGLTSTCSETSSGTATPRENVVDLPSRVTEGESSEGSEPIAHPLSPVAPPLDENNGIIDQFPTDVPLLVNRHSLPVSNTNNSSFSMSNTYCPCLNPSDVENIKTFVDEFCLQALIPYVERQIRYLNDVVTNRSRSKSLLSATRRWLGGSKVNASNNANSVVYSQEATELQTRRLGDLCFMFGLYEQAYNAYYTAKNDFKSDQAWLYFAGAQEMAALSSFMQNQQDFPKRYFEGSLHTYLNVCKVYNFAIRLTLLCTEVLKSCQEYGESAMIFIKMTSEESDLLSALMLEQAAHCFINSKRPLLRKYAFHMTLAGHRYSKAGQRAHSLRSYKQAFQVYFGHGWILAEDHIHYTMGKQAFQLKLNQESLEATTRLIDQGTKKSSSTQQSPTQQLAYMREFLNILDKCLKEQKNTKQDLISLNIPLLNSQNTKVLIGNPIPSPKESDWCSCSHVNFSDEDFREKRWFALERELITAVRGHPSMIFKPNLQRLTSGTPNTYSPFVPVKERISVQVHLMNPLLVSLTLSSIRPLYSFFDEQESEIEDDSCVIYDIVPGFNMPPDSEQVVAIDLWPQRIGRIHIKGIAYKISLTPDVILANESCTPVTVEVKQDIEVKGPRLNNTLQERSNVVYARDERLNIKVLPSLPNLSVELENPPPVLSCGEIQHINIRFRNNGPVPLTKLLVAISDPQHIYLTLEESKFSEHNLGEIREYKHLKANKNRDTVTRITNIPLPNGILGAGESLSGHLWLHAPSNPGAFDVELLFYYHSSDEKQEKDRYRLVRHLSSIYLYPSINVNVKSCRSSSLICGERHSSGSLSHRHSSNLVFHITNKCEIENSIGKVELLGVSVNSSSYALVPRQLKETNALEVGQSCQLCVQCGHVQKTKDEVILTCMPFRQKMSLPGCWWEFTLRERLMLPDLSPDLPPPNPAATYDPPPPTQNQIDGKSLKESLELDIVATVHWRGRRGEEVLVGQHSMYLAQYVEEKEENWDVGLQNIEDHPPIRIIKEEEENIIEDLVFPPLSDQQNLVKVMLEYPKEISHNFKDSSLCRVKFEVHFYNSSACTLMAEVEFSSKMQTGGGQVQMFSPEASMNLLSVGASTRKFTLEGFQSKTLSVHSIVTAPGTYSLGALSLKVRRNTESEWVPQVCKIQSGVVVRTESSSLMNRYLSSELAILQGFS
ncbi:UNVERIFIED_CONTAM: hypothetical protein RMT77_011896 [Armadillidium vulgare]|nr:Trafficking protein particle complex subunit 8 [Armadillidium vulgare]